MVRPVSMWLSKVVCWGGQMAMSSSWTMPLFMEQKLLQVQSPSYTDSSRLLVCDDLCARILLLYGCPSRGERVMNFMWMM